jgi:TPR repeat protein
MGQIGAGQTGMAFCILGIMPRLAIALVLALRVGLAALPARADLAAAIGAYEHDDFVTAFRLFEFHAERGSIEAEWRLGVMYEHGQGVPQDYRLAAERYRRAADQGHPEARADLAALLFHGHGLPRDVTEAVRLTKLAADQGVVRAQYKMGLIYQYGQRIDEDYAEA